MNPTRLPTRWQSAAPALKAVQVAFDVSEAVMLAIRRAAFEANLSNSDQIRVVLGLPVVRQAKRPRLTVSLGAEDYQLLGKRYRLDPGDHLAIKERVNAELLAFAEESTARPHARKGAKR